MDSHADTCVLGKNFVALSFTNRYCDVQPFSDSYSSTTNVPIAHGATAWDHPDTGETFILIVNEGLYFGAKMEHSLLNPNQIRHFHNVVQDNPYAPMEDLLRIEVPEDDFILPMQTKGVDILFHSRTPNSYELDNCKYVTLTSEHPWNPHQVQTPYESPINDILIGS